MQKKNAKSSVLKEALNHDHATQDKSVAQGYTADEKVGEKVVQPLQASLPSEEAVKQFFAEPVERAKKWNDSGRDEWQHPEVIVAALALNPGMSVADIGAGTGYMVSRLSKAVGEDGMVIAIDTSSEMVKYLSDRAVELGPAKIYPKHVGYDDPELQPDSVDRVLMLDTWLHLREQEAYAGKVYSGLKRGGRLVVVDYTVETDIGPPKEMRLSIEQVSKQLSAAGFRVEVFREPMPRHFVVVGFKD